MTIFEQAEKARHTITDMLIMSNVNAREIMNELLMKASKNNCYEIVKYLVEHGVDINTDGGMVLPYAVKNRNIDMVKYLVEHGADINAHDGIALRWAIVKNEPNIVEYLIKHGSDVSALHDHTLQQAKDNGCLDVIKQQSRVFDL